MYTYKQQQEQKNLINHTASISKMLSVSEKYDDTCVWNAEELNYLHKYPSSESILAMSFTNITPLHHWYSDKTGALMARNIGI